MATLDSLCGVRAAHSLSVIYAIVSGLGSGGTAYLFVTSANPLIDVDTGSTQVADVNGFAVFQLSQGTASLNYVIHGTTDIHATDRISNIYGLSWSAGDPVPQYYTTAPVLTDAVPGDTNVQLIWEPTVPCDARFSSETYTVRRSTGAPPPSVNVVTGLTVLNFLDTGRVNGTTYFYLIRATVKYVDDLITITNVDGNTLSATPTAGGEYWGGLRST